MAGGKFSMGGGRGVVRGRGKRFEGETSRSRSNSGKAGGVKPPLQSE